MKRDFPEYKVSEIRSENNRLKYCVGIPLLNEGDKIKKQLRKMYEMKIHEMADIVIFDGGSTDGSTNIDFLKNVGVKTLLIKRGQGKQGAQFRMGFDYVLNHGYQGVITIDGNGKDSIKSIPNFIQELEKGYDFIQGSRFIKGGHYENTPFIRWLAVRFIHAPWISLLARFWYTDTTSAYRGISRKVLCDEKLNLFRNSFMAYELLFFMSAKIPRLGYRVKEIPVTRKYPKKGKTPTKIKLIDNIIIIWELVKLTLGAYEYKR